ncbi:LPS export ABC transporter periplasmic protein LptC [Haemophilus paracuniculus]|uniref:Lipopolysaccharide export system protein LptC n=1 Tax=Haemophilus paracuniculus TaxID=734 RepID=A0A1T0ASZ5_9PAST|nr:LPS export ABC transporter periplasmic protein LptC [Haemophilus paracuniculus]OOR99626.1 LPS export ABC transporter periplasmic protein LptC [Haemophilus paracuniculus]
MNLRLNLILLAIVAVLAGWYFSQQPSEKTGLEQLIKKEGSPEFTGKKMETTIYDVQGKPQYFALAEDIKRFDATERTEFLKPLLNLFDKETAVKMWQVTADKAEINKENILTLTGNIKLQALDKASKLQKIETETLTVNLNTHDVYTDDEVKTLGLGFTTTGTGLKGNLKQQVATLTKNVKTYIEPTVIQQKAPNEQTDLSK